MGFLTWLWEKLWNGLLAFPLGYLAEWFGLDVATPWKATAWKIGILVGVLFLAYEVFLRIRAFHRKRIMREDSLVPMQGGQHAADQQFGASLEAVKNAERATRQLKKEKRWPELAAVYASVNKHKEAARYYRKARDYHKAAHELSKAGKTLQAARLLQKAGDHATAARFYAEKGKYLKAAQSYQKAGDLPAAAGAFAAAGKYDEAVSRFREVFAQGDPAQQAAAADECYRMLQQEKVRAKVTPENLQAMSIAVAERFDAAGRSDLAAGLFQQAGDFGRAADVLVKAGRLEEAAQSYQRAGRTKEAAEVGGRYYESKGRWKEAAMAYEGAGLFRRAGDCFSKANETERAAANYEQGGEYYGAGLAYLHLKRYDRAIPIFQKLKEDHPKFGESRALLGRCFYELKDYAHCAATLDNYLTGERVTSKNMDYFWMLALAYEQLGELEKSRELLLKIRTVDVEFRDVSRRLSNIETRISMVKSGAQSNSGSGGPTAVPATGGQPTAIMEMVENSLGKRYRLEKELGRGGMGVVYKAFDTQLDRPVALKFLGSLVDNSEEYRQRFLREARAAAKVTHPNIIGIYDIGADEGKAFIAMEFVEGPNLHKYLARKGKLEPREAVNIIGQACSALEAVHQAGIVHRDIKPDNILIARGGLVKLMDFGLAKSDGARLTGTNVVMGTPCYMAPEQVLGKTTDGRTDIYAMGLVMHELLTGKTVFLDGEVLERQLKEVPPSPGEIADGIPPLLDQIVMKCIAKRPEERFQSARELIGYLRQVGK